MKTLFFIIKERRETNRKPRYLSKEKAWITRFDSAELFLEAPKIPEDGLLCGINEDETITPTTT